MRDEELKQVIEALLFVATSPLSPQKLGDLVGGIKPGLVQRTVRNLNLSYQNGGGSFRIQEIAGGYQFYTLPHLAPWIERLVAEKKRKLSPQALETLAIIAYKGPINRPQIEAIRGVSADGVLKTLLERGLIQIKGRENSVGRPLLYGISKAFLQYFGLRRLSDLPEWKEFSGHGQAKAEQVPLPNGNSLQERGRYTYCPGEGEGREGKGSFPGEVG
jgi:segregation and condensation protein B